MANPSVLFVFRNKSLWTKEQEQDEQSNNNWGAQVLREQRVHKARTHIRAPLLLFAIYIANNLKLPNFLKTFFDNYLTVFRATFNLNNSS